MRQLAAKNSSLPAWSLTESNCTRFTKNKFDRPLRAMVETPNVASHIAI